MNKKIMMLLVSTTLFMGCNNESADLNTESTTSEEEVTEQEAVEEVEAIELPEESQELTEFPWEWEEDEEFNRIQTENDTDILIAGYVTVFPSYTPEEYDNISFAANEITGTILQPGEIFSQYATSGPYNEERGYKEGTGYVGGEPVQIVGGGVCKVATTLYNTAVASNLEVIERYNHSMPVPYVPYGQDAAVVSDYKDLKFENTTDEPLLMWAELIDNRLYIAFYGKNAAPEIVWEHETLSETETTTEYKTNSDLDEGDENIIEEGMNGKVVHSIIKVKDENGEEKTIDLGQSSYAPLKRVIEVNE